MAKPKRCSLRDAVKMIFRKDSGRQVCPYQLLLSCNDDIMLTEVPIKVCFLVVLFLLQDLRKQASVGHSEISRFAIDSSHPIDICSCMFLSLAEPPETCSYPVDPGHHFFVIY